MEFKATAAMESKTTTTTSAAITPTTNPSPTANAVDSTDKPSSEWINRESILSVEPAGSKASESTLNKSKNLKERKYCNKSNKYNYKSDSKYFTVIGGNINGIKGKKDSLIKNIIMFSADVCMTQETKVTRVGEVKIPNYQIFEVVRSYGEGGSLFTAIHEYLNPVFVCGNER